MRLHQLLYFLLSVCISHCKTVYVTKPVTNGYGYRPATIYGKEWKQAIQQEPYSCENINRITRICQLLFNTTLEVLNEIDGAILVEIPHLQHVRSPEEPFLRCWIDSDDAAEVVAANQALIPEKTEATTAALAIPFYEKNTHTFFCAGTEFVVQRRKNITTAHYVKEDGKIHSFSLDNRYFIFKTDYKTSAELRKAFLRLLYTWIAYAESHKMKRFATENSEGSIPYVWGGMSIGEPTNGPFLSYKDPKSEVLCYTWTDAHAPPLGVDCSGVIALAMHILGIKPFPRNTSGIATLLPKLAGGIEMGDLLCFRGHVFILDPEGYILEARAYSAGYGKLHALPINEVFANIATMQELKEMYLTNEPLALLDLQGNVSTLIEQYAIYSLDSYLARALKRMKNQPS